METGLIAMGGFCVGIGLERMMPGGPVSPLTYFSMGVGLTIMGLLIRLTA